MNIVVASSSSQIEKACIVLQELRPQYSLENLIQAVTDEITDGYKLVFVEENENVLSVAGFSIAFKLAWKTHIYIDDFVTSEKLRSRGAGKTLLNWIKEYGRENGCGQIHLDSGVQRFAAHKFYLREDFKIASHHFSVEL